MPKPLGFTPAGQSASRAKPVLSAEDQAIARILAESKADARAGRGLEGDAAITFLDGLRQSARDRVAKAEGGDR